MSSIITIILFFLYLWGLGFTTTYFVKKPEHFWERQFLNLGIGLGVFPLLSILLNFLHLPLDWKIFLLLSIAFPIYTAIRLLQKKVKPNFSVLAKITKSDLALLVVLFIVLASFYMYASGAFGYPYLEDEDPWGHAVGAKYVSIEKNAYDPQLKDAKIDQVLSYIDPYPPAYDILMGVLHQTSPDLNWTLKFFNALIISLGFLFFYLFAKSFIGDRNKAVLATFIFALIPCYLSHFIWAHSLVITIFFPLMYALAKIKEDQKWMYVALLIVASVWVSQNVEQPLKLSTMILLYLIVISITHKKFFTQGFIALGGGVLLSFLWWGMMIYKYTLGGSIKYFGGNVVNEEGAAVLVGGQQFADKTSSGLVGHLFSILKTLTNPGGSASRAYTFSDFFTAQANNQINNPIGIGMVISLLTFFGVFYLLWRYKTSLVEEKNTWLVVALVWLIFTFWGVNGMTFPISVAKGAFRVWMLLAIPVALVAAEGLCGLSGIAKKYKIPVFITFFVVILGMVATSGYQKYQLNTAIWPTSGSFGGGHPAEPFEYGAWFESISPNSAVFLYAPRDKVSIGFGSYSCDWCQEVKDFREDILNKDAKQLHTFLKGREYQYLVINPRMDAKYLSGSFGENKTTELLPQRYKEIMASPLFTPVYQKENLFLVFQVN